MFTVKLQFADDTLRATLGDTGKVTEVPLADIAKTHPDVIRLAAINGFLGALNNISRGKDEAGKANSDDVWASMRDKRVRPWVAGSWASVERESASAGMREAYVDETRERTKQSAAQVEKDMAALVREVFGEKEKATFTRFLDALASKLAKARDMGEADVRDKLEAKYRKAAADAAAARAEASKVATAASLDLDGIEL